jgi:NAD(P)-dependent dehydrogenase (short-subunit alcohol dehydrogenase family)
MSKPVGQRMRAMKRRGSFVNVSSIAHLHKGMLPGGFNMAHQNWA